MDGPLIWGRGIPEWFTVERWKKHIHQYKLNSSQAQKERMWTLISRGHEMEPMTYANLISYLKSLEELGDIRIWTEGYNDWKEVYQIHKIMDDLGISRRVFPRVPITGTALLEHSKGNLTVNLASISEGGMGVTDGKNFAIGEKYKCTIKSPNLFAAIHATGEIVFIGNENYAGFKFIGLPQEAKSAIVEYVKKFTSAKKEEPKK
jgi:hypothetical protein